MKGGPPRRLCRSGQRPGENTDGCNHESLGTQFSGKGAINSSDIKEEHKRTLPSGLRGVSPRAVSLSFLFYTRMSYYLRTGCHEATQ